MPVALVAAAALMSGLPDVSNLMTAGQAPSITYLDRNGAFLGRRGGGAPPAENIDRLPAYVPGAFVAVEDKRFYEHGGFDPIGIAAPSPPTWPAAAPRRAPPPSPSSSPATCS